ncbi:uncharacterized protein B0H18DRAFT_408979 [Fomitopsis serialis]|uniref:uncharacterized protein n=1 Tax=Fomitopsis serialis TaxID=139415 RepID=UPI002007B91F|nr:uncharacterized protein B0H18DRAFT_408979 [Neoantrodia serialis]KAH9935296.1 hypothetical protein B0H18DRAFT_408979 [Neoantrodia serialis]
MNSVKPIMASQAAPNATWAHIRRSMPCAMRSSAVTDPISWRQSYRVVHYTHKLSARGKARGDPMISSRIRLFLDFSRHCDALQ